MFTATPCEITKIQDSQNVQKCETDSIYLCVESYTANKLGFTNWLKWIWNIEGKSKLQKETRGQRLYKVQKYVKEY